MGRHIDKVTFRTFSSILTPNSTKFDIPGHLSNGVVSPLTMISTLSISTMSTKFLVASIQTSFIAITSKKEKLRFYLDVKTNGKQRIGPLTVKIYYYFENQIFFNIWKILQNGINNVLEKFWADQYVGWIPSFTLTFYTTFFQNKKIDWRPQF